MPACLLAERVQSPTLARELAMPNAARGQQGPDVRRLQEWLCLRGIHVTEDGDFGPATQTALGNAKLTPQLWEGLTQPLRALTQSPKPTPLDELATMLTRTPGGVREVGGPNPGPWVRLFMDGNQGPAWPWCAGFATWVLRGFGADVVRTFSCDVLAESLTKKQLLQPRATPAWVAANAGPGSLFFVTNPARPSDRVHVGIVLDVVHNGEAIVTLEGNTNDEGSREGYEVCERTRAVGRLDVSRPLIS